MSKKDFLKLFNQVIQTLYSQNFQDSTKSSFLEDGFQNPFEITPDDEELDLLLAEDLRSTAFALAKGILEKQEELDIIINKYLHGWKLERLGLLELLFLRAGIFSISQKLYNEKNIINAIKNLASAYGLESAKNFIAAVLAAFSRDQNVERE